MLEILKEHLDRVLDIYTQGEHFEELKAAKELYFSLTGKLDEDREEFEARMNCFNDWYIFQYKNNNGEKVIEDYIRNHDLDVDLSQAFLNVNHSLFEFAKINFRKQIVLKDVLHDEKVVLMKDHPHIGLVEGDIFIGRVLKYKGEFFLLKGVRTLPTPIKSILKKQSKKVRKMNSFEEEHNFLLKLENFMTKTTHYAHIDPAKIFVF